ncbi:msl8637 [Mesorhizobium japonicum MAFF 303099]|uniref:Msl8637 protein n=1 Tax=Mesorhizobium japonicum (strain LMG 29417 / CECT 9101 / MAFF 303099) TaxID=266835 RepID=Q98GT6_RHILO|nr:msl8637 [Mesorhizobium japonicum MAFF 303099]
MPASGLAVSKELSAYLCPYLRLLIGEGDAFGTDTHFTLGGAAEGHDHKDRTGSLGTQLEHARRDPGVHRLEILIVDVDFDLDLLVVWIGRVYADREDVGEAVDLAAHRRHRLGRCGNGDQADSQRRRQGSKKCQGCLLPGRYSQRSVTVA